MEPLKTPVVECKICDQKFQKPLTQTQWQIHTQSKGHIFNQIENKNNEEVDSFKCNRCKEIKPFTGFYKNKRIKRGFEFHCINCAKKKSSEYFICECGDNINKGHKQRHLKTAKHAYNMSLKLNN